VGFVPGGVLALDLSSNCGVAYGPIDSQRPWFACWRLPRTGGEGARYAAFENELAAAMDAMQPSHIVLEAALSLQALASVSNIAVTRQQLTLRGVAYMEGYRASVAVTEVSSDIVRYAMLGQSHFKKGTVKSEVIRYCRERGIDVWDDNAADAILTFLWHCTQLRGGRAVAGPLFAGALQ
jgi:Holliday junction resolvasome RuvABC endonuclease subunit